MLISSNFDLDAINICTSVWIIFVVFLVLQRYIRCDGRPDPFSEPDVMTFLTAWSEKEIPPTIEGVVAECEYAQQLYMEMHELAYTEAIAPYDSPPSKFLDLATKIQEGLVKRLDAVTGHILQVCLSHLCGLRHSCLCFTSHCSMQTSMAVRQKRT